MNTVNVCHSDLIVRYSAVLRKIVFGCMLLKISERGKGIIKNKIHNETLLLGVAEAEALTGVSRWTWRRWAYDGKVASVKLGKRLLSPRAEISRLVDEGTNPRK